MPEGPELHLASQFVNLVCKGRIFAGKICKSEVSKHLDVNWEGGDYTISAVSRGKELKLTLCSAHDGKLKKGQGSSKTLDILFNFGMSGKFDFYEATELKKHAHLNFYTKSEPKMVLSFVDYRRFGKWQVGANWSPDRGPCVIFEYLKFRDNVLQNIDNSAFNKPICEALLNQKFFNGIGNYLRAEILYRAGIPPFVSARSVLEPLLDSKDDLKIKSENPDILQLCNVLPLEVVNLGGTGYDPEGRDPDYSKFSEWLRCYYNPHMKNMADHNKRTIWYHGNPGPMTPKDVKIRGVKRSSKVAKSKEEQNLKKIKEEDVNLEPKSTKITRKTLKEAESCDLKKRKNKKEMQQTKAKPISKKSSYSTRQKQKMKMLNGGETPDKPKVKQTVNKKKTHRKKGKANEKS